MGFLRNSFATADAGSLKTVPQGKRIYAIGDIHGRSDLLNALASQIQADLEVDPCPDARTIFLGDYIDRGMNSFAVVDRLAQGIFPTPILALRGNHEATLLDFIEDPSVLSMWRHYGAVETLASYGVDVRDVQRGRGFAEAREKFLQNLPLRHLDFYRTTPLWWSCGDYFFCHAGVRPGLSLARQQERDLLWIRNEFLLDSAMHEKVIVHGHTPADAPENLPNRINVDTGAYATGGLTCVVLEGNERRFLSTLGCEARVTVR